MSTNLHCKEIELWQTPSYVTEMCYNKYAGVYDKNATPNSNPDMPGDYTKSKYGVPFTIKTDNWIAIRERYILWVQQTAQDNFNRWDRTRAYTDEEHAEICKKKEEDFQYAYRHIKELRAHKLLHFNMF